MHVFVVSYTRKMPDLYLHWHFLPITPSGQMHSYVHPVSLQDPAWHGLSAQSSFSTPEKKQQIIPQMAGYIWLSLGCGQLLIYEHVCPIYQQLLWCWYQYNVKLLAMVLVYSCGRRELGIKVIFGPKLFSQPNQLSQRWSQAPCPIGRAITYVHHYFMFIRSRYWSFRIVKVLSPSVETFSK